MDKIHGEFGSAVSVLFLDFSDGFLGVYLVITVVVKLINGLCTSKHVSFISHKIFFLRKLLKTHRNKALIVAFQAPCPLSIRRDILG